MAGNNTNYAYIHDTLLRKYRRNSLYIIWAVILNFIGLLLAVLDYINNIENSFGYGALYNFVGVMLYCYLYHLVFRVWYLDLKDIEATRNHYI